MVCRLDSNISDHIKTMQRIRLVLSAWVVIPSALPPRHRCCHSKHCKLQQLLESICSCARGKQTTTTCRPASLITYPIHLESCLFVPSFTTTAASFHHQLSTLCPQTSPLSISSSLTPWDKPSSINSQI